jgi:hypothetical protein
MKEPTHYILTQLQLECIGFDENELLVRIPGPDPDDIARVLAYKHSQGFEIYFRQDVPRSVRNLISSLSIEEVFARKEKIQSILDKHFPCNEVNSFESYVFEDLPGENEITDVDMIDKTGSSGNASHIRPVFAMLKHGKPISSCISVRQNDDSAECYTHTGEGFRRRGLGRKVTAAWGRWQLLKGRIPFYSHASDNTASRALAESLNLSWKFRLVAYS